jgi:hypothetical protein
MTTQGFKPLSVALVPTPAAMRAIGVAHNHMLEGKLNVNRVVTLAVNAATTTFQDPRLSVQTGLHFEPNTANAAVAKPTIWVSAKTNGQCTINHINNAASDKTFTITILG